MTSEERDQIRDRIQAEMETTRAAIEAQSIEHQSISPDRAIGRVSRMDSMYNQQVNAGTLRRNRERLSRLEYVLTLVDTPGFGRCEFCQSPIPFARLRAMPESTTCMRCAAFAG
jgi:DnaK suppressor protein